MTEQQYIPNSLVLVDVDGEPRIDSRIVAGELGVIHSNTCEIVDKYFTEFQELGKVRFQTEASGKTNQKQKFYLLNEDQTYFLMTLVRNTGKSVVLKKRLVEAFAKCRRQPPAELTREQILVIALDAERGRIQAEKERDEARQQALEAQPMVQFHEEVTKADAELNIDETCAVLFNGSVKPKELRTWLKTQHWMDARPGMNKPTAWAMTQGLMRLRLSPPTNGRVFEVPVMTGKGIALLRHLHRNNELFINAIPMERRLAAPDYPV